MIESDPGLVSGFMRLGNYDQLESHLFQHRIDKLIIDLGALAQDKAGEIAELARKNKVQLAFIPSVLSFASSYRVMYTINGVPVFGMKQIKLRGLNAAIKRFLDLFFVTLIGVAISPLLFFLAIGVWVSSPGPIIYSQERIGRGGKKFMIYKFRSMRHKTERSEEKEKEKGNWTVANDYRRTGFGKFIRKTSLDELPQLWNICKGDMSLIGPRPEQPFFVDKFKKELPRYDERHQIRPGLTGWAQVNGWRGNTSITERLQYDLFYIDNWSMVFDLRIIVATALGGFTSKGAY